MYTEKCVSESERHRGDAVCWLFCFVFFLLFYALWPCMLSVQCIISQTASTGLLQFGVSAGRHRGTGPTNELAYAE